MGNESVSKEDRERLEQLSGEIMERIRVVADILAVSIDKKSGEPIKKFSIFVTPKSSNKNVNMVEILFEDESTNMPGLCYQDPPGICCNSTCPCMPIVR
jgi:hypothetical protein